MSNSPPSGFNITTTPHAISAPPNGATKVDPSSTSVQQRTHTIGPLTKFDSKSGLVVPAEDSPWKGEAAPVVEKAAPVEKPAEAAPDRRAAWQAEQEKTKAERARKTAEALEKRQPLARDFLKKGDLSGAAKALGMTAAEFREYAQNVLLTIPTPDAELTPEQKREADEKAFREEQATFRKEQETFRYQTIADNYIRDKVRPVLADKEKFEFIAQQDSGKIEAYIYNFMDQHFRKTGEELKAIDVAETIEAELEKTFTASVERHRSLKKVGKLFAPKAEETAAERPVAKQAAPAAQLSTETAAEEEAPDPNEAFHAQPVRAAPKPGRTPFALMSREERLAMMREEEEKNP